MTYLTVFLVQGEGEGGMEQEPSSSTSQEAAATGTGEQDAAGTAAEQPSQEEQPMEQDS